MRKQAERWMGWSLVTLLILPLLLGACGTSASPVAERTAPPTSTPAQPTATPTRTSVQPTVTPVSTSAQPAATSTTPPTDSPATSTASPTAASAISEVEEGQALLVASGCAACHGANGEGLENLGPALAGHSREAVFEQVRAPRPVPPPGVQMPAFGPDQISDEDLEKIVAFIQSLGPPAGAGLFSGSMTEAAHLRLALVSLQAGDVADAQAHLRDLVASAEGEVGKRAEEVLSLLEQDQLHEAEHELEMMLLQAEGSEWTTVQLHIILALNALQGHNDADAVKHLADAIDAATGDEKARLEKLLTDLQAGKAHDVQHELEKMLDQEPHSP